MTRTDDTDEKALSNVNDAIMREKQLKHWVRAKKNLLIETQNPNWEDMGEYLI